VTIAIFQSVNHKISKNDVILLGNATITPLSLPHAAGLPTYESVLTGLQLLDVQLGVTSLDTKSVADFFS
jgi:hypothetical protein